MRRNGGRKASWRKAAKRTSSSSVRFAATAAPSRSARRCPYRASLSRQRRKGVPTSPRCGVAGSAFPPAGLDTSGPGLRHTASVSTSKIRQDTSRRPSSRKLIFQEPRQRPLKAPANGPACNFFPTLDAQGSSPEIHRRGIALRPRSVPIRAGAEHPHRRCSTNLRWTGAILRLRD